MNQQQAMNEVQVAMHAAQDTVHHRFILVYLNGQIYCQPVIHQAPESIVICELRRYDLDHGLTSQQWNQIEDHIRKLITKGKL